MNWTQLRFWKYLFLNFPLVSVIKFQVSPSAALSCVTCAVSWQMYGSNIKWLTSDTWGRKRKYVATLRTLLEYFHVSPHNGRLMEIRRMDARGFLLTVIPMQYAAEFSFYRAMFVIWCSLENHICKIELNHQFDGMRKQSGKYFMYLLRLNCSILQRVRIVKHFVSSSVDCVANTIQHTHNSSFWMSQKSLINFKVTFVSCKSEKQKIIEIVLQIDVWALIRRLSLILENW